MITSLTAHVNRIAVGDCRDGILFFSYQEVSCNCKFFFILALYFYCSKLCLKISYALSYYFPSK